MNETLGGLFSSRINLNLREAHGYTYGARSQFSFRRDTGLFAVRTGVRTDVTAPAVTEIMSELRRMRESSVTPDELTLAKDSIVRSIPADFETGRNVNRTTADLYVYDLGLDYYAKLGDRIGAISGDQVRAAAEKYIKPDTMVIVAVGDRARISAPLLKLNLGPTELRKADGTLTAEPGRAPTAR
jgi:zinc protease